MNDKSKLVKELFENISLYLTYDYNLRIRKETVEDYTKGLHFDSVLDAPCGTGGMSIPLLNRTNQLTLIDISRNMLDFAQKNIPAEYVSKVELINDDLIKQNFNNRQYDLVISLGILAHVNSPEEFLNKISTLVKPGGMLIIQNTDSNHIYSHLIRMYLGLKSLLGKQPYQLNKVGSAWVEKKLGELGFKQQHCFRYNQSFLGLSNLFSNEKKYDLTRRFFGYPGNNLHSKWGSDHTYLFIKNKSEG